MKTKLSFLENAIHFSAWSFACFYSLYILLGAQTDIFESNSNLRHTLRDLNPGWRLLQRLKDESDVEWSTWKYLVQTSWFYMLFQFFISEIIRRTNISILKYWYMTSSVIFIANYMGVKHLLMILIQPVIYWAIIFFGGRRISIWMTSIVLLAAYNSLKYKYYFWYFLDSDNDEEIFIMLYAVAWVELRCISFSLDYIDKLEKFEDAEQTYLVELNVKDMFSYVLYLPVLFVGPIIIYEEFEKSFYVESQNLLLRLKRFIWNMILYVTYTVSLEFALHYIYFIAMQSNMKALEMLPPSALCGAGLWMGLQFHLKYVISYGTTTSYARLDNIDPPPTPRCIARIHVYSQMWRYFDVGLYRFLFKYIYIPVYNLVKDYATMSKMSYKMISSFATFIFIYVWHGTTWNIFVWSILNYFGIILESAGKAVGKTTRYLWFKDRILITDAMEIRFIAFLCAPLLGLSAISNFYLFAGSDVGNLYVQMIKSSFNNFTIIYLCLYCCCHVAIALQDVPSRTDVKTA